MSSKAQRTVDVRMTRLSGPREHVIEGRPVTDADTVWVDVRMLADAGQWSVGTSTYPRIKLEGQTGASTDWDEITEYSANVDASSGTDVTKYTSLRLRCTSLSDGSVQSGLTARVAMVFETNRLT